MFSWDLGVSHQSTEASSEGKSEIWYCRSRYINICRYTYLLSLFGTVSSTVDAPKKLEFRIFVTEQRTAGLHPVACTTHMIPLCLDTVHRSTLTLDSISD